MAKRTANSGPKDTEGTDRLDLADLTWVPLDEETTAGKHGLTPLLLHRFGHLIESSHRTVAQVLVDRLLERALDGHHQSLEEIMTRIDGDARSIGPAVKSTTATILMDEPTAQRLLHALRTPDDDIPGD